MLFDVKIMYTLRLKSTVVKTLAWVEIRHKFIV
jgi:hypothetical protein